MTPDEYQELTRTTEIHHKAAKAFVDRIIGDTTFRSVAILWMQIFYCTGKLNGEAGEIAEIIFKALRDGKTVMLGPDAEEIRKKMLKELGDIQWYIAQLADLMGFSLEYVMENNIAKLQDRKERGVLSGSGDDR